MRHSSSYRTTALLTALFVAAFAAAQAPDTPPDAFRASEAIVEELRKELLPPPVPGPNDAEVAGLPKGSKPAALTWERVYALALVRSRGEKKALADELDPAELDREAGRLGVADFARFRADFLDGRAFRDPSADFLDLQRRLQRIENARRQVAAYEHLLNLLTTLILGETSTTSQIDLARVSGSLLEARRGLAREVGRYRDRLDALKVELGLSPGASVVVDGRGLSAFPDVFAETDRWFTDPKRRLDDLARLSLKLPGVGVVEYQRRPILTEISRDPDSLGRELSSVSRAAVKHWGGRVPGESDVTLELRVRRRLRRLAEVRESYGSERSTLVLALRQKDAALERLIAPPAGRPPAAGAPSGVVDLLARQGEVLENRDRLVDLWTAFQAERLAFYRDLGAMPLDDWKSFYAQFQAVAGTPPPADPGDDRPPSPALPRPPQAAGGPSASRPAGR